MRGYITCVAAGKSVLRVCVESQVGTVARQNELELERSWK